MITLVEQPQPQIPDPVLAIEQLPDRAERAQALLAICRQYGVGVNAEQLWTYGKAWRSLIDALQRERGAILMLLPGKMITSEPFRVIGPVLDAPPVLSPPVPRPLAVMSWPERFGIGSVWEAVKSLYVDNLCRLLSDMKWSPAEVARAKEQLMELLTENDRIEQLEHDRIPISRPGPQGRTTVYIQRAAEG